MLKEGYRDRNAAQSVLRKGYRARRTKPPSPGLGSDGVVGLRILVGVILLVKGAACGHAHRCCRWPTTGKVARLAATFHLPKSSPVLQDLQDLTPSQQAPRSWSKSSREGTRRRSGDSVCGRCGLLPPHGLDFSVTGQGSDYFFLKPSDEPFRKGETHLDKVLHVLCFLSPLCFISYVFM